MTEPGEPVTIRPGTRYDADDNPTPGTGAPVPLRAVVEPAGSQEHTVRGRNGVYTRVRVYLSDPLPAPISRHADIEIRGQLYAIGGDPAPWIDPDGSDLGGLVIDAYRAEG